MAHTVTLIPGDGIGPEIAEATKRVLEATGVTFEWDVQDAGQAMIAEHGTPMPDHVLDSIRKNRVAIKGPITTPVGTGFRSVNVALRQTLDLYANLRPARSYKGVRSRFDDVDLIIVRENTEGLYAGIEFEHDTPGAAKLRELLINELNRPTKPDSAYAIKVNTISGCRRIIKFAYDYARRTGRKKVTAVHKANILKYTDGLFLEISREVAKDYPEIESNDVIIDNMCMQLVQKPDLYDVMVLPNLFGDIVSDLCAGLVGGLGMTPGANIGELGAVFEPVHGSAPKYAGLNKANPSAMMLCGVLMLRHLGELDAADRMESAIAGVIAEGKYVTYDLKPERDDPTAVGTSEMADAIIRRIKG